MKTESCEHGWLPAPVRPVLAEREVHLWRIPLDAEAEGRETLSGAEQERGRRFLRAADGHRFLNARARLRYVLGQYTGTPPAALAFQIGRHGKPEMTGRHAWLRFNLSHSGGWMLLALSHSREVGVDLEAVRSDLDFQGVAAHCFRPDELQTLQTLSPAEQPARFYALWTATEARLKARGLGFLEAEPDGAHEWHAYPVWVHPDFAAAVAVEGAQPELHCWSWPN